MSTSTRYHLLPEETGRPSVDSNAGEDRRLINEDENSPDQQEEKKFGFKKFHITFYLRLIAFILLLTSAIILGTASRYYNRGNAVPSLVVVTFALARNFLVIWHHLIANVVGISISISFQISNRTKHKFSLPAWLKGRVVPFLIDLTIIVALFIVLPIGLTRNYYWWDNTKQGFLVAFSGIPFYFFAIIDGGDPKSIAISGAISFQGDKSGDTSSSLVSPSMNYRDIEAQLPQDVDTKSGNQDTVLV